MPVGRGSEFDCRAVSSVAASTYAGRVPPPFHATTRLPTPARPARLLPMSAQSPKRRIRDPELFADGCVHYVSVVAGMVGGIDIVLFAWRQGQPRLLAGVAVYAAALLFLVVGSALNNLAGPSPRRSLLRRLDHAGILLLIAGTYPPFMLRVGGAWGHGLLAAVWLAAAAGIVLLMLDWRRFERLSTAFYLVLGWVILVALPPLVAAVPLAAVVLLAVGGVLYSVGAYFHHAERIRYNTALWHGFVLAGAACHYAALWLGVVLAPGRAAG